MTSWHDRLKENDHLEEFFDYITLKSKDTRDTYLWILKGIIDFSEEDYIDFNPEELNQRKYRDLIRAKSKKNKKSTLNLYSKIFSILTNIYELNIEIELLRETDKFTDYIRFEELYEIIDNADKEIAAVTAFIFCTGLRPISVISIEKSQLMLNAANPYVRNVYLKGGKRHDIIILYPDIVLPLLRWYLQFKSSKIENYDTIPYVFVSQRGNNSKSYIYHLVSQCKKVLGRPVSPRMLRKGLGIHTKELGWQDEVRRMLLGHGDIGTTIKAYSDYSVDDIVREFNRKRFPQQVQGSIQNQYYQPQPRFQQMQSPQPSNNNQEFCPFCGRPVEYEMILCPYCGREIKKICDVCKRYVNATWEVCPYCATKVKKRKKYEKGLFIDKKNE